MGLRPSNKKEGIKQTNPGVDPLERCQTSFKKNRAIGRSRGLVPVDATHGELQRLHVADGGWTLLARIFLVNKGETRESNLRPSGGFMYDLNMSFTCAWKNHETSGLWKQQPPSKNHFEMGMCWANNILTEVWPVLGPDLPSTSSWACKSI